MKPSDLKLKPINESRNDLLVFEKEITLIDTTLEEMKVEMQNYSAGVRRAFERMEDGLAEFKKQLVAQKV